MVHPWSPVTIFLLDFLWLRFILDVFTGRWFMSKRRQMNRRSSEKYFTRTAGNNRVHPKNGLSNVQGPGPMRGGIRL